jgi:hypothetical protein
MTIALGIKATTTPIAQARRTARTRQRVTASREPINVVVARPLTTSPRNSRCAGRTANAQ